MAPSTEQRTSTTDDQQSMLHAQLQLWHHTLGYVKSMALKAALDLCIPDAIDQHGSPATLPQIVAKVALHPSKTPCLRRLMRVLTVTSVFTVYPSSADGNGELVYGLTPASRLMVASSGPPNLSPFLNLMLGPIFVSPFLDLGDWFQHEMPDPSLLKMTHGRDVFDLTYHDASFGELFGNGMVADSGFIMDIVVKECSDVFQGISSLVDVAGGLGASTQIIANAFPHVECSVLELSHVAARAPASKNVKFFAGDMFESIPSANAIFLKFLVSVGSA